MKTFDHRFLPLALAAALSVVTAATAVAAPAGQPALPSFKAVDRNGDGTISPDEFQAQGGLEQAFREADANHDNRLSQDEFTKAVAINDRARAGKFVDDAVITAKVKALLLKDEGVKGLDVKVDTHKGTVQLSGWVNNATQIAQAEKIALGVEGVKAVRNNLLIKH